MSSRKKDSYSFQELESLNEEEFSELIGITDEQAIQSDVGGDSDADDYFEDCVASDTSSSVSTRSRFQEPVPGTSFCVPQEYGNSPAVSLTPQLVPTPTPPPTASSPSPTSPSLSPVTVQTPTTTQDENLNKWSNKKFRDPPLYRKSKLRNYVGLQAEVDLSSPMNILSLFLTPLFFDIMLSESNKYATQCHQNLNTTAEELKKFIGILIIMGFHTLPSMRLYWSQNQNFHVSRISSVMSMRRFLKILKYLHANDNTQMIPRGQDGYDRLFKIRPLLQHFSSVFGSVYKPHQQLSVDESMIAFKGRTTLKQYMPLKPIKRGFKVWVICCAVTGFMLNFDVYEGKSEGVDRGTGLGESVVLKFARMFEHLESCLFFDRFFTSFPLLVKLLSMNLFGVGTIMPTRKFFSSDKLPIVRNMALGESACAMTRSNISVSKWRDRGKKAVWVASSMHNPSKKGFVRRTNNQGDKEQVPCPTSIVDYNKYKGGVDKFDQHMSSYNIAWKSRRWWLKIWYYLIEAAIVNAYIIYKDTWSSLTLVAQNH